jgi:hypothetical protein
VIKRGVIIGIGTVFLVIGLTGLGLLQTGVIYPPASTGPASLPEIKQLEQTPGSARSQAEQAVQQPSPAQGGQQAQSGTTPSEKPAPQEGKGSEQAKAAPEKAGGPGPQARKEKFDENRLRALLKSEPKPNARKPESKRYAGKTEPKRHASKAAPANTSKPVVIRFNFDPAHDRRLNVARVHLGDKIRVKVRRIGQVDRRVFLTFSESLNSTQGAVLKLLTMPAFESPVMYRPDHGYYVIEIKIYPNNRWNITPRSFV